MTIRVGTSGWSYRHWRDVFYPAGVAQKTWLDYYAQHFDTVEVNSTFYRLPSATTVAGWTERVPDEFRFSVKVSRYLTHTRRLRDPKEGWDQLAAACGPLGSRLGAYLVQLPPRFAPEPRLLAEFLGLAPQGVPIAVEFRDPQRLRHEVRTVLEDAGAAVVWSDFPGIPTPHWITAGFVYVRRHGIARYAGSYGMGRLEELAETLRPIAATGYCYFNNDLGGAAVADAAALRDLLDRPG